ncbi:MAG: 30S ribosomal protein S13 [Candidatus Bathyarchaeota archaeon B26-2]|mgnify:CR=1 FL=1|nr:MAG: 30S ribosomal protein S13 [Candidatus Bathyarchaeota archaeon B26-2]
MPKEFRHIVRMLGTDLNGTDKVVYALTHIKGIGIRMANAIVEKAGINPDERVGFLSEAEVRRLEAVAKDPVGHEIPTWLLNRRKDLRTGEDLHLLGSDLDLQVKADIDLMKAIRSWRGYRHAYGLKVRGQRTRTTGRTGKTVGVRRRRGR